MTYSNHSNEFFFMGFEYILFDGDGVPNDQQMDLLKKGWKLLGVDYYPNDRTKLTTIFRRPKQ